MSKSTGNLSLAQVGDISRNASDAADYFVQDPPQYSFVEKQLKLSKLPSLCCRTCFLLGNFLPVPRIPRVGAVVSVSRPTQIALQLGKSDGCRACYAVPLLAEGPIQPCPGYFRVLSPGKAMSTPAAVTPAPFLLILLLPGNSVKLQICSWLLPLFIGLAAICNLQVKT